MVKRGRSYTSTNLLASQDDIEEEVECERGNSDRGLSLLSCRLLDKPREKREIIQIEDITMVRKVDI
jgi:hypothetical protein